MMGKRKGKKQEGKASSAPVEAGATSANTPGTTSEGLTGPLKDAPVDTPPMATSEQSEAVSQKELTPVVPGATEILANEDSSPVTLGNKPASAPDKCSKNEKVTESLLKPSHPSVCGSAAPQGSNHKDNQISMELNLTASSEQEILSSPPTATIVKGLKTESKLKENSPVFSSPEFFMPDIPLGNSTIDFSDTSSMDSFSKEILKPDIPLENSTMNFSDTSSMDSLSNLLLNQATPMGNSLMSFSGNDLPGTPFSFEYPKTTPEQTPPDAAPDCMKFPSFAPTPDFMKNPSVASPIFTPPPKETPGGPPPPPDSSPTPKRSKTEKKVKAGSPRPASPQPISPLSLAPKSPKTEKKIKAGSPKPASPQPISPLSQPPKSPKTEKKIKAGSPKPASPQPISPLSLAPKSPKTEKKIKAGSPKPPSPQPISPLSLASKSSTDNSVPGSLPTSLQMGFCNPLEYPIASYNLSDSSIESPSTEPKSTEISPLLQDFGGIAETIGEPLTSPQMGKRKGKKQDDKASSAPVKAGATLANTPKTTSEGLTGPLKDAPVDIPPIATGIAENVGESLISLQEPKKEACLTQDSGKVQSSKDSTELQTKPLQKEKNIAEKPVEAADGKESENISHKDTKYNTKESKHASKEERIKSVMKPANDQEKGLKVDEQKQKLTDETKSPQEKSLKVDEQKPKLTDKTKSPEEKGLKVDEQKQKLTDETKSQPEKGLKVDEQKQKLTDETKSQPEKSLKVDEQKQKLTDETKSPQEKGLKVDEQKQKLTDETKSPQEKGLKVDEQKQKLTDETKSPQEKRNIKEYKKEHTKPKKNKNKPHDEKPKGLDGTNKIEVEAPQTDKTDINPADQKQKPEKDVIQLCEHENSKQVEKTPTLKSPLEQKQGEQTESNKGEEVKTKKSKENQEAKNELVHRYMFIGGACHICKRVESDGACLKICAGCRLVLYCSVEHQKKHWSHHKQLCRTIKKILVESNRHVLFEEAEGLEPAAWRALTREYVERCEASLERPLTTPEYEMLMHPIACYHCHLFKITQIETCQRCFSVCFCSPLHAKKGHAKWCDDYRTILYIARAIAENGIPEVQLPDTVCTVYKRLPGTWKKLINRTFTSEKFKSLNTAEQTTVYDQASLPLSLLHLLETGEVDIGEASQFSVHIVGGAVAEKNTLWSKDQLKIWETWFLNLLPKLKSLEMTVFSSEADRAQHWIHQDEKNGKSIKINILKTPTGQYVKSKSYVKAEAVLVCNVRTSHCVKAQTRFLNDIKALATEPNKPVIITSATIEELEASVNLLKNNMKITEKSEAAKNPFRSTYPKLNFTDSLTPIVFANHFATLLNVC